MKRPQFVKELDILLTMSVLEDTLAVLSLGKLCDEHGYSYEWINGQKPHISLKTVFGYNATRRTSCRSGSWFINEFSSGSLSSTSLTPSWQEIDHPTSSSRSSTSPPMTSSTVSSESVDRQERRDPYGMDHHPAIVSSDRVERQERVSPYSSEASEEFVD